ncbi:MAG: DUF1116 domain-containing protein [Candidatus Hodarchaeales archaeon]
MDIKSEISQANKKAIQQMNSINPVLVDIQLAKDVIPKMTEKTILHAGPPITWERMCGPMKGSIAGILVYEGLVNTIDEGYELASSGDITIAPNHDHDAVGPMTGITAPNQPVFVLEDKETKQRAYCTLNEGRGKVLRFGGWGEEVLNKLYWIRDVLSPILKKAINHSKGIDIKRIISESLHMGDEGHNRNRSGSYLFLSEIIFHILDTESDLSQIKDVISFIKENADIFHLNLSMPHSKLIADVAREIEYCSLIVALARNGTDTGIQVSALGRQWFASPALSVEGLYFPGYGPEDACPDLGDSTISETIGIGGFCMASAPAIVNFVGSSAIEAIRRTELMYEITTSSNPAFTIPALDFRGVPAGIDIRKVVESNQPPLINTGIAHKDAGIGQIGAGLTEAPMEIFVEALKTFAHKYQIE